MVHTQKKLKSSRLKAVHIAMDLIDIYIIFHPKATKYTFFSSSWNRYMLSHKASLNKFKIEVISSIFSDHSCMKKEINYKKEAGKLTNMQRINSMLLNNQLVKEEITEKLKKKNNLETNENGYTV